MKKIFILLLITVFNCLIFGEPPKNYQQLEIYKIKKGNKTGELGFDARRAQMGADPGVTTFSIDSDGFIYVCDSINNRINIYDPQFKFVREVKSKDYSVSFSKKIKIDDKKNMLIIANEGNLIKIDSNNELVFKIYRSNLPSDIDSGKNFFPYDDKILYYDSRSKEKIKFYNANGEDLDDTKVRDIIQTAKQAAVSKSLKSNVSEKVQSKINKFIENKKIMVTKVPLTTDFSQHREYYELLKGDQLNGSSTRSDTHQEIRDVEIDLSNVGTKGRYLIGFDSDNNSYWNCDVKKDLLLKVILILSPYGEILDAFYNNIKWSLVAVAPGGDVYFLSDILNSEWVYFHKTERVW